MGRYTQHSHRMSFVEYTQEQIPKAQIMLVRNIIATVCLLSSALTGCSNVKFYEKSNLADPAMQAQSDPAEQHLRQKVFYSREGSIGGSGMSAGGGCGCY